MSIGSFTNRDKGDTENCFLGNSVSRKCPWQGVYDVARKVLINLNAVEELEDLRKVPGYRLELLGSHGKKQNKRLAGFYSIRINNRWRVVFRWTEQAAVEAEVALGEEGTKTTEGDIEEGEALEKSQGEPEQIEHPSEPIINDAEAKVAESAPEAGAGETANPAASPSGRADDVEIIDYH